MTISTNRIAATVERVTCSDNCRPNILPFGMAHTNVTIIRTFAIQAAFHALTGKEIDHPAPSVLPRSGFQLWRIYAL
ncbi:hypothetical protein PhaeoP88_04049 (plasmid) [Phaeobacter inhibens]|uniref:Uncharacterized protein n=1 Tax=Phaeobacter inhibens TaxID=221822 RepID=A0A2I7KFM9_9RHOB|nr:hypothetical protein PhaeoP88_04049 [Phaeobacter inhibens]